MEEWKLNNKVNIILDKKINWESLFLLIVIKWILKMFLGRRKIIVERSLEFLLGIKSKEGDEYMGKFK